MGTVLRTWEMPKHCSEEKLTVQLKLETRREGSAACVASEELPLMMSEWLDNVGAGMEADKAVVARARGQIIGFVRWTDEEEFCTYLHGTFVKPGFRGLGLARAMWEEAVKHFKGKIDVVTTSLGGEGLVASMKKKHPEFEWFHDSSV